MKNLLLLFAITSCQLSTDIVPDCQFPTWPISGDRYVVWIDHHPGDIVTINADTIRNTICRRDTTGHISDSGEWSVIISPGDELCIEDYSTGILTDKCCTKY